MEEIPLDDDDDNCKTTTSTINEMESVGTPSPSDLLPTVVSAAARWNYWRQCFGIPADSHSVTKQRQAYGELLERHALALLTKDEESIPPASSPNIREPSSNNDCTAGTRTSTTVSNELLSNSNDGLSGVATTKTYGSLNASTKDHNNHSATTFAPVVEELDPLNAIIQEQDQATARDLELERQYYRRRTKQQQHQPKRFDETPDDAAAYRELIAKDLHRLAPIVDDYDTDDNHHQHHERIVILRRILMLYSLEHQGGYLQGMHEIASFVLYFVSKDHATTMDTTNTDTTSFAEADTYVLTCCILQNIAAAYDLDPQVSVLYQSQRVLHHLQPIHSDLYTTLRNNANHIPFQLIFTKWIRLLFGREITRTDCIGKVWDALFAIGNLQIAAEALAAARLWQNGNRILALAAAGGGAGRDERLVEADEDLMHYCMNMPVMEDPHEIDVWIRRMRVILRIEPESPDLVLPPVVSKPYGMLPQQQQLQIPHHMMPSIPHHLTPSTTLWDPSHAGTVAAQLTSFTEKLAAQTQHLSKRFLSLEWETLQQHSPLHHSIAPTPPEPTYNLNYYPDRSATTTSPFTTTSLAPTPAPIDATERLRRSTAVLQQFAISVEQTAGVRVPPQVWTALSDLEALQHHLH